MTRRWQTSRKAMKFHSQRCCKKNSIHCSTKSVCNSLEENMRTKDKDDKLSQTRSSITPESEGSEIIDCEDVEEIENTKLQIWL